MDHFNCWLNILKDLPSFVFWFLFFFYFFLSLFWCFNFLEFVIFCVTFHICLYKVLKTIYSFISIISVVSLAVSLCITNALNFFLSFKNFIFATIFPILLDFSKNYHLLLITLFLLLCLLFCYSWSLPTFFSCLCRLCFSLPFFFLFALLHASFSSSFFSLSVFNF